MGFYKSRKNILLLLDILAITLSFVIALKIRYEILIHNLGSRLVVSTYVLYFTYAMVLYVIIFYICESTRIEKLSYKEIIADTIRQQITFIAAYMIFFFMTHNADAISRVVVTLFFCGNVLGVSILRCIYHDYCLHRTNEERRLNEERKKVINDLGIPTGTDDDNTVQHVYIIGSKSIGLYGGYESFVMNLLQQHEDNEKIKYHVACKANGNGCMNINKVSGIQRINDVEFTFHNAHCFMIHVPVRLGSAQAIYYDVKALQWCCEHIEINHIQNAIVYILASRIGPFEGKYAARIHKAGGRIFQNPDGRESKRLVWNSIIRKYWKLSEALMIKNADMVICDSQCIESYIQEEYVSFKPKTIYIPYGAHLKESGLSDNDRKYTSWLKSHNLIDGNFYITVGRLVPENNFDIMIREFMASSTTKDLAIISTRNPKYIKELLQKTHYRNDRRIKFVGTVYDIELIAKIREKAFGYIHGHSVGGTNPSLLEALATTSLNLVYDVEYNKEVARDAALYFSKEEGSLKSLIEQSETMTFSERDIYSIKAKKRIRDSYTWENIADKYMAVFR